MELSGLIFVALAVAWAAYLIPKALQHHDEVARSRSVEAFSARMRVLARREIVDRRSARLVVTPARAASAPIVNSKAASVSGRSTSSVHSSRAAATPRARREAASKATSRRRRVLGIILLLNILVAALAGFSVVAWWTLAAPVALLAAWLVACRLMVRRERSPGARTVATSTTRAEVEDSAPPIGATESSSVSMVMAESAEFEEYAEGDSPMEDTMASAVAFDEAFDPHSWDPLPVTLPTYVSKPAATRRTVRTIDLESTGVWSSGRSEIDSALARGAEDADRTARAAQAARDSRNDDRAVGS